jgi:hypothetical protein
MQGCLNSSNSRIALSLSTITGRTQGSPSAAEDLDKLRRQSSWETTLMRAIQVA